MATRKRTRPSARLRRLRDRIDLWRRTRPRRTAMPADLWSDAVAVARIEGAYPIARELRLNLEGLRRRMAEDGAPAAVSPPSTFMEITGAELLGRGAVQAGTIVELADQAGIRLTVRLAAETVIDLPGLIAAFRQRGG